jgi:signal recognition particle subunit SEC65
MEKGRDYPNAVSLPRNKLVEIMNIKRYALLLMQFNFIIFRDVVYPNRQIPF